MSKKSKFSISSSPKGEVRWGTIIDCSPSALRATSPIGAEKVYKFKGFTMAEVLIAIAIIGVIAALVLPVMMKNYNNRIFATKARRAYTAIVDACSHGLSDDQVKYPGDIINSYCEYIPGKSCTTGENGSITLKDGTVLTLTGWGNNPGGDLEVTIDTNDTKGPNEDGRDKWYTKLTRDCKLADDGSNRTISYLKAHDWKITDDDASGDTTAQEPEPKCSFYTSYSICKQDDGTTKWCKDWAQTNCQTFDGECKRLGTSAYFSCPDEDNQKIYDMTNGSLKSTFSSNCTHVSNNYMSCPDGDNQKLYQMYDGKLKSTLPSNCTAVSSGYMSCPDGDNTKIYDMSTGSLKSTFPSNCTAVSSRYMSCPDGDNQKIYDMTDGSLNSTLPSNCTAIGNSQYMSCPDGENQKIYYYGSLKSTLPGNCTVAGASGYMSCFDGTQTKLYNPYSGQEQTSYAKAGDCAYDSNNLYVCTNGNKKTYYFSVTASASSSVEVDADCADPLCSNKQ